VARSLSCVQRQAINVHHIIECNVTRAARVSNVEDDVASVICSAPPV
jgi:hypothetical protein